MPLTLLRAVQSLKTIFAKAKYSMYMTCNVILHPNADEQSLIRQSSPCSWNTDAAAAAPYNICSATVCGLLRPIHYDQLHHIYLDVPVGCEVVIIVMLVRLKVTCVASSFTNVC